MSVIWDRGRTPTSITVKNQNYHPSEFPARFSINKWTPTEWAMRFFFVLACVISAWLGWRSLKSQGVPGCGMGSSCSNILTSSWARLGPVPVSLVGALFYGVCAVFPHFQNRKLYSRISLSLFGGILCSVAFFVTLQAFILRQWCPWCCSIHGLALIAVSLGLWIHHRSLDIPLRADHRILPNLACGILASMMFFFGGFSLLPAAEAVAKTTVEERDAAQISPSSSAAGETHRSIALCGGKFTFDLFQLPHEGLPNAKHVIISIIDPTCPHCRTTSKTLHAALKTYPPDEVAVLFLPGVRDPVLGPAIQQMMLALWQDKPGAWLEIHQQLDESKISPDLESIRNAISRKLGGRPQLEALVLKHHDWTLRQIEATTALMAENGAGKDITLPQTIIGKKLINRAITDGGEVQMWARDQFGLTTTSPIKFQADGSDPCNFQSRNVCGRLIISFLGAGKISIKKVSEKDADWDGIGIQSASHFKQFSPLNPKISVQGVAISSDDKFNEFMPTYFKGNKGKFVGIQPNSVDALKDEIFVISDKSQIQKAINNFEKDPACIELKKKLGTKSVMPFIITEILVDGEYAESDGKPAIPSWPHKTDSGNSSDWSQNKAYFGKEDWRKMIGMLKGSIVHTFLTTCKGSKLAYYF